MATKKTAKKTTEPAPQKAEPAAKPVAKKAAKKAAKQVAPDPTPVVVNELAELAATKKAAVKKVAAKPSLDAIARAAYLNYRRRVEQGLPGNSHSDWLEAERQVSEPG